MKKALLFINGLEPTIFPEKYNDYSIIVCTDGAYDKYVNKFDIKLGYLIGDMDSIKTDKILKNIEYIYTPDQEKTDFEKALDFLIEKNIREVDIYGGTGQEEDHFIGNISTALHLKNKIKITFFDDFSTFFFSEKEITLNNVKNKIISLIPFFETKNIITKGLKYPLNNESLIFGKRIGTRNEAIEDNVKISYSEGDLLIFIQR